MSSGCLGQLLLEQAQPIRLLALWLDKLLRLDPSKQAERAGLSVLHLTALELRCLGCSDSPWRGVD